MQIKTKVVCGSFVCGIITLVITLGLLFVISPRANAAINQQINFQGKLTNPDGTNVTDGSYSVRFRVYTHATNDAANVCSANSCKWEETQGTVTVTDGVFQVSLGSVNTNLATQVDFNVSGLWLGVKVGSDAEMTPRIPFTAAPYAFNSEKLNGIASTGYIQLGQSASAQQDNSNNASVFIDKNTGTGNILQLQKTASDVFVVNNAGNITATGTYNSNTFTSSGLQFGAASAALIQSATSQALNITGHTNSTFSTDAGTLIVQGFGQTTLASAAQSAGSTNSAKVVIATGNASGATSTAGNIEIDVGTSTTSNGSILIGTAARTQTITIGNATGGALRLGQNGSTVQIDGTNFDVSTAGAITIPGAQTKDITTTGTNALTIDTAGAAALNLGTASTNAVSVGRSGVTTTNNGALTVTQLLTGNAGATIGSGAIALTGSAASSLTTSSGALTLTSAAAATWSTSAGTLTVQGFGGTTINTPNATGATNNISIVTGNSTTSGATGTMTIKSGDATSGTSGNILVDNGSSSTGSPQLNLGTTNARAIALGNVTAATTVAVLVGNTATAFTVQGTGGNAYLTVDASATDTVSVGTSSNGAGFKTYLSAGNQVSVVANAAPTADMVSISNTGQAVTTAGVSGLQIDYIGGNAAIEASGARVNVTPGGTSGGTWNGLRIVANATGPVTGVTENGIKLEGPTSPGAGSEVGVVIDANWDAGLQLGAKTSDPGSPATDNIYVYARKIAGRSMLRQKGSSGVSFAYQPALFEQAASMATPTIAAEAVASVFSNSWAVSAPGVGVAPTASETQGYTVDIPTTNTTGSVSTVGQSVAQWFRGSVAGGSNGFFYVARLLYPDASYGSGATGARIWNGLTNQAIGNVMTNGDNPAGDYAGFQYSTNRGDTNWQFMTKNSTTQNVVNTNMAFTVGKVYDFYVYVAPQGTTVFWRIDNLTDGTTQENSTSSNLPTTTVAMRGLASLQTLTTTGRNFRLAKIYIESDR